MNPGLVTVFRLTLATVLAVVTWLALTPLDVPMPGQSDKLAHAATFLLLAFLADHAFPRRGFDLAKILPLLVYGLALELIQGVLPYRYGSFGDLLADAAGLLIYIPLKPYLQRLPLFRSRPSRATRS